MDKATNFTVTFAEKRRAVPTSNGSSDFAVGGDIGNGDVVLVEGGGDAGQGRIV